MSLVEELALLDEGTNAEATHYETGNWTKMTWASKGLTASAAGASFQSFGPISGSYWSAASFSHGGMTAKYVSGGLVSERWAALWACLNPALHSGYRCQFLDQATENHWIVHIFKVVEGTPTELVASAEQTETLVGAEIGFVVSAAGTLEAWWKPAAGAWTKLISVADATFNSGNVGLEGTGSNPKWETFKGGSAATVAALLGMVV